MKLFQRMLVAPAALGLLAPAAVNAADLNIDSVSDYSDSVDQVTSITQFSDVYPTDWAYQALSNLIERYGCVAGYPNGTYRGNRAMTRYEAAALLNACLDRISEVTDELRRLIKEFERELAIIRGRVDGLEARVGELEATQFSTTTKLEGQASFVFGANTFGGDTKFRSGRFDREINEGIRGLLTAGGDLDPESGSYGDDFVDYANGAYGATVGTYDIQLTLVTSFTGKDNLTTNLRAGNFGRNTFGGFGPTNLSTLEVASEGDGGPNSVFIDKLWYDFPLGENFTVFIGPNVGQDDMMPIWPSVYISGGEKSVLDVLTLAGAPGAYNKTQGPGGALNWESNGWNIGVSYVSDLDRGADGNPNEGGLLTENSGGVATAQIGYMSDQWAIAGIYSYVQDPSLVPYSTLFAQASYNLNYQQLNTFALSGYWQPENSGWIPSISVGWGINTTTFGGGGKDEDAVPDGSVSQSQSWTVGLEWDDVFLQGNSAGMAVGQPTFATELKGGDTPYDGNYVWEWWYNFQVTDNISVTPAMFYLSRPLGMLTGKNDTFNQLGGLLRTTFTF